MRVSDVVAMGFSVYGESGTDSIMCRLHEISGAKRLLIVLDHLFNKPIGIIQTADTGARNKSIGMLYSGVLENL